MSWLNKTQAVTEVKHQQPEIAERDAEQLERTKEEWRSAERDFNLACEALREYDRGRLPFDAARSRAKEKRDRLLAAVAALEKKA